MKQRIEQWKKLVSSGDPEAPAFLQKITDEARAEGKLQEMSEAAGFLLNSAARTLDDIGPKIEAFTMHERLGSLSESINLAFIARHYFGKTRQWLYQRLKGQIVNGKPASFTPAEEATFMAALSDIGLQISALTRRV